MANKTLRALIVGMIATALCAGAAAQNLAAGTFSGQVKDSAGKPQMGVLVELFNSAATRPTSVFTDVKGFYTAAGLAPGTYYIKATAASFLPSLRENVELKSGANVMVNLTLSTLLEAFQFVPARRAKDKNDDDWGWTLRSAANRPILRALEKDGPLVVVSSSDNNDDRVLKARVAFIAGDDPGGFSTSDVKTTFNVEQSLFGSGSTAGVLGFNGNVAYGDGQANGVVRATYKKPTLFGTNPEFALTARRYASPLSAAHHAALNALSASMSDTFSVNQFVEFHYGAELQSVQFRGRVMAFRPFGAVDVHLTPDTLLEYKYATSRPTTREEKGFDTSPLDLSEANPRVSLLNSAPQVERARHQEVALSKHVGKNNFQAAYYSDVVHRMALTGVGDVDSITDFESANILPDVYNNTFAFNGGDISTQGMRLVAQRMFSDALTATLDYAYGGALEVENPNTFIGEATLASKNQHAVSAKLNGQMPVTHTRWIASYKWTNGNNVVTTVDGFNASAGQADPYLSIFVRQPIPGLSFMPGRVEALVDVRNLLSQGYVPMIAQDGRTVFLVQSSRAIRGGFAFNF
jgi:hypothetical protein